MSVNLSSYQLQAADRSRHLILRSEEATTKARGLNNADLTARSRDRYRRGPAVQARWGERGIGSHAPMEDHRQLRVDDHPRHVVLHVGHLRVGALLDLERQYGHGERDHIGNDGLLQSPLSERHLRLPVPSTGQFGRRVRIGKRLQGIQRQPAVSLHRQFNDRCWLGNIPVHSLSIHIRSVLRIGAAFTPPIFARPKKAFRQAHHAGRAGATM